MEDVKTLNITSIEELKKSLMGEVLELPPFVGGQKFVARLTRPSIFAMAKSGKIPNSLLTSANSLFEKGVAKSIETMGNNALKEMFDVLDLICEESFIEPSYKDLKAAGIQLTDEQILFVFDYTQNGLKNLESFR